MGTRHCHTLASWIVLLAVPALLGGCDTGSPDEERAENQRLQAEIIALRKQVNDLNNDLEVQASDATRYLAMEKEVTARLGQELEQLRAEDKKVKVDYARVKADYDRLQADLRRAAAAAAGRADPDPASAVRAPEAKTSKPKPAKSKGDKARIRELEMQEADIKGRIAQTQATIGLVRSKISSLAKGTVDVDVREDGRDHIYRDHIYVKPGDFRTVKEKNEAVAAAKAELAPSMIELHGLEAELAKVQAELVELRSKP